MGSAGGIGKTVLASMLARDRDVRTHFELILWITLSQTPNLGKLQQLLYLQATGAQLPQDKSDGERKELITVALRGRRCLLVLDVRPEPRPVAGASADVIVIVLQLPYQLYPPWATSCAAADVGRCAGRLGGGARSRPQPR
jgi:hypothetical protein